MAENVDDKFYVRADAHINLSNQQMHITEPGKVNASMMYGAARFNAWLVSRNSQNKADFQAARDKAIAHFVEQYRIMLTEHMDDYTANFATDWPDKA